MWNRLLSVAVAVLVVGALAGARSVIRGASGPGHLVVVKMVKQGGSDYRFSPAEVKVQQGDTIRWVEDSDAPHNVQFDSWPKGAKLGGAQMGPLLVAPGQTYQLVIDGRFPVGTYAYSCTPHSALGMKAKLVVGAAQ